VTKPFSPRELVARVGAVLRRARPSIAGEQLAYADIEMDLVGHKVKRSGETVLLGPTEFRLLRHFLERPGRVFSRERLLDSVWGHNSDIELRTVDVHIRRLRKAINSGGRPDIIRTVRSAGYALDSEGAGLAINPMIGPGPARIRRRTDISPHRDVYLPSSPRSAGVTSCWAPPPGAETWEESR
jgi:DNA-binding winged helix-turn-helix (wHTH) protein